MHIAKAMVNKQDLKIFNFLILPDGQLLELECVLANISLIQSEFLALSLSLASKLCRGYLYMPITPPAHVDKDMSHV